PAVQVRITSSQLTSNANDGNHDRIPGDECGGRCVRGGTRHGDADGAGRRQPDPRSPCGYSISGTLLQPLTLAALPESHSLDLWIFSMSGANPAMPDLALSYVNPEDGSVTPLQSRGRRAADRPDGIDPRSDGAADVEAVGTSTTPAGGPGRRLFTQQLADRLQILDVIADRLDHHQHRHREHRSPHAPHPAPEKQAREDGRRVDARRAAHERGRQQEPFDAGDR